MKGAETRVSRVLVPAVKDPLTKERALKLASYYYIFILLYHILTTIYSTSYTKPELLSDILQGTSSRAFAGLRRWKRHEEYCVFSALKEIQTLAQSRGQ